MPRHEVIVGNIGRVTDTTDFMEARESFNVYVAQSKEGYGRAAGESITWLKDGEPEREFVGEMDKSDEQKRIEASPYTEVVEKMKFKDSKLVSVRPCVLESYLLLLKSLEKSEEELERLRRLFLPQYEGKCGEPSFEVIQDIERAIKTAKGE